MKKQHTILACIASAFLLGCSSIDGDQVSVRSANEVNENITYHQDTITKSKDLQTASYWSTCDEQFDGAGYRYRTSLYQNGEYQIELYVRLKSSRGAYELYKAFNQDGENFEVKGYKPEVKSETVVYEHVGVLMNAEQLDKASQKPMTLHLVGQKNNCTITVEQPVSFAFQQNLNALLNAQ